MDGRHSTYFATKIIYVRFEREKSGRSTTANLVDSSRAGFQTRFDGTGNRNVGVSRKSANKQKTNLAGFRGPTLEEPRGSEFHCHKFRER